MTAYYVRPDLEIVADSIAFNVDGVFKNKVSLELSANRTEPHTDLEVYVTADPDSTVYLLAVDQSALLLKTGNDITPRQVEDAVAVYDEGTSKPSDSAFALSLSRQDIANTMQEVGINVYSDANLYATSVATSTTPYDPSINGPVPTPAKPKTLIGDYRTTTKDFFSYAYPRGPGYSSGSATLEGLPSNSFPESRLVSNDIVQLTLSRAPSQPLKEVERVRNLFPETWLWLNQTVGINGSATIHTTVPDTITSWITTAFASNLQSGLGVGPSPAKLTVFRSFFVSLTLPTSVIRGEYVVVQASVFNYLPSDIVVVVKLPASNEYTSVTIGSGESETVTPGDQERTVNVKSNEQAVVYFPIIPTALGAIDIEVSARSTLAADAERRQLIVEAEGMPGEFNILYLSIWDLMAPRPSLRRFQSLYLMMLSVVLRGHE
ncbi:CD109 antigen-like [Pomacea canaliculata]|uniref:CD109 antigen-like n=1 Tax=Pomacea canaliculata TaxID=400727 RepID=UPI000D7295BB|nr:CD109 antigen-like [Pomacea canaliculata]